MFDSENLSMAVEPDLKLKRRSYDGLFKARVVSEWINGRGSLRELAERYDVHPNQIKNWKSLLLKRAGVVLDDKRRSKAGPVARDIPRGSLNRAIKPDRFRQIERP